MSNGLTSSIKHYSAEDCAKRSLGAPLIHRRAYFWFWSTFFLRRFLPFVRERIRTWVCLETLRLCGFFISRKRFMSKRPVRVPKRLKSTFPFEISVQPVKLFPWSFDWLLSSGKWVQCVSLQAFWLVMKLIKSINFRNHAFLIWQLPNANTSHSPLLVYKQQQQRFCFLSECLVYGRNSNRSISTKISLEFNMFSMDWVCTKINCYL